jgi:hypothetical protein
VLPSQAWRVLPAKIAEVMEELKAVEVRVSTLWASLNNMLPTVREAYEAGLRHVTPNTCCNLATWERSLSARSPTWLV